MHRFNFSKFIPLFLFPLFFIFAGCSQKEPTVEAPTFNTEKMRKEIVSNALKYLNTKKGKDCSGFVALVNFENGEPYYKKGELSNYFTNNYRSKAIYNVMKSDARITKKETPQIADLVFFADTLEKSKRKKGAANITHIGIITQIDEDGTIHFIHNIRGKNIIGVVNEKYPSVAKLQNKNINTYLKRCEPTKPKQECLSPFFLSAYGDIEKNLKFLSLL